ncbi:hypothetical protein LUZ60_013962 [Juncus effusus]|nr:hypothetical protein LUZ60_013962 [Juncus effusus]
MTYRALDLTLISARELKNVNHFSKLQVYGVASLAGDPRTRQRTPTDRRGGENPTWDYAFHFVVPTDTDMAGRLAIHVVLRAERIFGDREIGEAHIPLKDLVSSNSSNTAVQFASYQVHKPDSRNTRGTLNISYKLGDQLQTMHMSNREPVTAYPPPEYRAPHPQGYPPPQGYPYLPPQGYPYGYPSQRSTNFGMGLGTGLLGGLLIGDMISNVGMYDAGYDAGGFDGGFC